MTLLVDAIAAYAPWLYVLVGALVLREAASALRASRERRDSVFGLEREAATGRLVRSLVSVLLLAVIALGVMAVDRVLAPSLSRDLDTQPGSQPFVAPTIVAPLPPPTATATPIASETPPPATIHTATPER